MARSQRRHGRRIHASTVIRWLRPIAVLAIAQAVVAVPQEARRLSSLPRWATRSVGRSNPVNETTADELAAICSSLATVIPPMMAAGAAPSREAITLDHVFAKYYPTGLNLPPNELFLDLPPGTLLPSDDAKGSITAAGSNWDPDGVIADMGYGYETDVQSVRGGLPSFCRFGASIITSPSSQVYTEVWLPLPDTAPTPTVDPNPIPFDNSTSSDGGASEQLSSPAVRLQPIPLWVRAPWQAWQERGERARQRRDELKRRQQIEASRRPPPDFVPAPDEAWHGRMIHIGGAAAKGAIIWPNMKQLLARYREVIVADNNGHFSSATSEQWATTDETRRDSGYRASHLSTMVGQVVTKTFYGVTPGPGSKRRRSFPSKRAGHHHHHHFDQEPLPPDSSPFQDDIRGATMGPLPPGTQPEDGDYSDVAPIINLDTPYSDRLGFNSYFLGCSSGGRQALSEAGLYPADYDGILSGSPAISFSNVSAWQIWINDKVADKKAPGYIPMESYPVVRAAVLRACDGLDGVLDGVISNTTACSFDLFAPLLACPVSPSPSLPRDCFSPAQLETLEGMYANYTINDDLVHTGLLPGSELAWSGSAGITGQPFGVAPGWFFYQVLNLTSGALSFDPFKDVTPEVVALGSALDPGRANTWYTNLSAFLSHGKLLHTHGLSDPLIPPGDSVRFYEQVGDVVARGNLAGLADSYRLFLVPGMGHCRLGDGPYNFGGAAQTDAGQRPLRFDAAHDATLALFAWVENGTLPAYLVGAAYKTKEEQAGYVVETAIDDDRRFGYGVKNTRKLCAWPLQAHLRANATKTDVAASFECR